MQDQAGTLTDAMATEPLWLKAWLLTLVSTHMIALLFIVGRSAGRWIIRYEAIAIFVSFFAAGALMNVLFEQFGYTRILGLAHLVFWTPAYAWVALRRKSIGTASVFGKYLVFYLVIAGICLAIDAVDVARFVIGDTLELYG